MKTRNIIFLAMLTLVLFFVCNEVFAQDSKLETLLKGKQVEFNGVCRVDSKGLLTFDDAKTSTSQLCSVGGVPGNENSKWILLFSEGGVPTKLIRLDKANMKQTVLWINPKFQT